MNNTERSVILIASMSKSEKRGFKLYCNIQDGEKAYLTLFDIIEREPTESYVNIHNQFRQQISKTKHLEIVAGYLYQILLNFLTQKQAEKRIQSKIYHLIEKANILFERKLVDEAFDELNKAYDNAMLYEDDMMQIIVSRTQMSYLSLLDFPSLSEKELIAKQMRLLEQMKYSRTINQYNFLLDILNYRLLYKDMTSSEEKKQELNDLVLSELNLVSNNPDLNFQSQKLHLLFQSTYYLEVGNYKSAVRNYKRLIELFGENSHLMLNPPVYYLSAIDGVLDCLLTMGVYYEMEHFMRILRLLNKPDYPTDFQLKVSWLDYYYQMSVILHTGNFEKIDEVQKYFTDSLLKKIAYLSLDLQLQFYLINTLLLFIQGKNKEAHKMIKNIFSEGKIFQRLPLFRMTRLIHILIYAELGDFEFIENEINALKRNLNAVKISKTEKLIFKFVQAYPLPAYLHRKEQLWKYYKKKIESISGDKFERRVLKHFNFLAFIESRLTDVPLTDLLSVSGFDQADLNLR